MRQAAKFLLQRLIKDPFHSHFDVLLKWKKHALKSQVDHTDLIVSELLDKARRFSQLLLVLIVYLQEQFI